MTRPSLCEAVLLLVNKFENKERTRERRKRACSLPRVRWPLLVRFVWSVEQVNRGYHEQDERDEECEAKRADHTTPLHSRWWWKKPHSLTDGHHNSTPPFLSACLVLLETVKRLPSAPTHVGQQPHRRWQSKESHERHDGSDADVTLLADHGTCTQRIPMNDSH
ncbi:hypothetical protein A3D60_02720 [Candidatus Uhrbacteria bacterium RIFCSPHIGHO2_02_FULL_47_29]|nr:MAG: hypothetical protein A3D60_02720 [Candidatus Uhrbacteria bacterium RIFCSPHIGHO2_02_FULL_47_29]